MTEKKNEPETSHCTDKAYRVEVRATRRSLNYGDHLYVGQEWTALPERRVERGHGVADDEDRDRLTRAHGYYGAIALAASFLDHLGWLDSPGIEVRIVEYRRSIDYTMERLEEKPFPDEIDEIFARAGYADRVDAVRAEDSPATE